MMGSGPLSDGPNPNPNPNSNPNPNPGFAWKALYDHCEAGDVHQVVRIASNLKWYLYIIIMYMHAIYIWIDSIY